MFIATDFKYIVHFSKWHVLGGGALDNALPQGVQILLEI